MAVSLDIYEEEMWKMALLLHFCTLPYQIASLFAIPHDLSPRTILLISLDGASYCACVIFQLPTSRETSDSLLRSSGKRSSIETRLPRSAA